MSDVVSLRLEAPIGCAMCGAKDGEMVMTVHRENGHKAVTCSSEKTKCTGNFWVTHSKHHKVTPANMDWSHRAKVIASKQLLQAEQIRGLLSPTPKTTPPPQLQQREPDQKTLEATVNKFTALKKRLAVLYSDYEKHRDVGAEKLKTWLVSFDQFMRDLNELYSSEFTVKFLSYACDLELLRRQNSPQTEQLVELLREIVKSMPLNRVLSEKRELLKTLLGFDKYPEDKLVLTLDGGGMKGMVTLVVLKELRDLLRKKTGIHDLRIEDCFDLVIGTSTGGIITSCMCAGHMDLEQIFQLYEQMGSQAFSEDNKTDLRYRLACRYADYKLMRILYDLFGSKRLDDPEVAFKDENQSGPQGVRFGFTTVDMSTNQQRTLLLRNYQKVLSECCKQEDVDSWIEGTDQCYLVEAVRATASPPGIIHPYGRFYAPLENHFSVYGANRKTQYSKNGSRLYTHMDMILDHVAPSRLEEHIQRSQNDVVMKKAVLIDGGLAANNPGVLALMEARRLYAHLTNYGIRMVSIGTGELPVSENPSWNSDSPTPLDQGLTGRQNIFDVHGDLIKFSYVFAATGTEEVNDIMNRFGTMLASYRRLNPKLRRAVEMDDASPEALHELFTSSRIWCQSEPGRKAIEETAQDIYVNSSRLHALIKRRSGAKK